jgi:hypothetical protein
MSHNRARAAHEVVPRDRTEHGRMLESTVEAFLRSRYSAAYRGGLQLVSISLPFPLDHRKKYYSRSQISFPK